MPLAPDQRDVLQHPTRRAIFDHLHESHGARLAELYRALRTGPGCLRHHLDAMEAHRLIRSHVQGRARLYFPRGFPQDKTRVWAILHRRRSRDLLDAVLDRPGIAQWELLHATGMSRKVLREQVTVLQEAGLLEERREDAGCRYHPSSHLLQLLDS